jgi:hypothetical protein
MEVPNQPDGSAESTASLQSIWKRVLDHLEQERRGIHEEIKNYPRPIPACDAQFNHLLEQRTAISQELAHLHRASSEQLGGKELIALLDALAGSSPFVDQEMKEEIMTSSRQGFPNAEPDAATAE